MELWEYEWREAVLADQAKLRQKRANRGHGRITYHGFRLRLAAHYREGLRLGVGEDDHLMQDCRRECVGWHLV